jgi:superfamily I DNA/RNA helicase
MVINNIFYCGDTAQAITRGVSFRFEDLKLLFNQEHYNNALTLDPPEDIISLTVNFRSHNYILQLANSIVSSLEILFPT